MSKTVSVATPIQCSFPVPVVTIGFNPATYSVHENDGNMSVTVEVLNGELARSVVVTFLTVSGGTAMGKSV